MTTTKRQKQHASDRDELPIPGAGKGHGPRKPPHPKGEKGYTGRLDPDMYARLSRPWPSREAGHVTILAAITVNDNGKQVGFMESHHSGDVRNQLAMVAAAFRTLRERNDEEARAMAGLAAPDIVPLTPDGTRMVERITAAMQDRLEAGQVWTPLDTMNALMANEAMRAETHGALLDLMGQGPRSPAEEIGALRGALGEILSVATARVERITRRIREIEAEHPDLKVPPFSDPAIERENRESLERQRRAAAGVAAPAPSATTARTPIYELGTDNVPALIKLQAACYPPALHDSPEAIVSLIDDAVVAIGHFRTGELLGAVFVTRPTDGGPLELYSVEVALSARRTGIGTALVRAAMARLPDGSVVAYCTTAGQALLLACGFTENGKEAVRGGISLRGMAAQVKGGAIAPLAPKERDLARCNTLFVDAAARAETTGDNPDVADAASREEQNMSLAIALHGGDPKARAEVARRYDALAGYLMLRGGTDFLNDCRAAVAEKRWGDLVQRIAGLEDDLVRDKRMHRNGVLLVEPVGEPRWHIPTNIDPGGPLL